MVEHPRVGESGGHGSDGRERDHEERVPGPDGLRRQRRVERVERDAERRRDLALHVVARHGLPPLRAPLLHPHARDAPVRLEELEGERAEADLDRDGMDAVGRAGRDLPERRHDDGGPDRRVAGVRDLLHGHERALEIGVRGILRRQDERGLGIVDLARDGLHLLGRQAARVRHDEELVAR